jgi:AAA domain
MTSPSPDLALLVKRCMTGAAPLEVSSSPPIDELAAKFERIDTTKADDGYEVVVTPYSDIDLELIEWAWEGRIPRAAMAPFVGTEEMGKSSVGFGVTAQLSRGTLPGCFEGTPQMVALLTTEDSRGATIRPRLQVADADLTRVVDVALRKDKYSKGFSLPGDTERLLDVFYSNDIRFVWADPLVSLLNPSVNTWKDTDIREAIMPLVSTLEEIDVTLAGPLHTNKQRTTDPRAKSSGSPAWRQVGRAELFVGLDPESDDPLSNENKQRCIAHTKSNLGGRAKTIRFVLTPTAIEIQGEQCEIVRAVFGEDCDVRASEMLSAEQGFDKPGNTKRDIAYKWLERFLEDGPKAVDAIKAAAAANEPPIAWRTVERVKPDLNVKAKEKTEGWVWTLGVAL